MEILDEGRPIGRKIRGVDERRTEVKLHHVQQRIAVLAMLCLILVVEVTGNNKVRLCKAQHREVGFPLIKYLHYRDSGAGALTENHTAFYSGLNEYCTALKYTTVAFLLLIINGSPGSRLAVFSTNILRISQC
jgi:hypothetical protein